MRFTGCSKICSAFLQLPVDYRRSYTLSKYLGKILRKTVQQIQLNFWTHFTHSLLFVSFVGIWVCDKAVEKISFSIW